MLIQVSGWASFRLEETSLTGDEPDRSGTNLWAYSVRMIGREIGDLHLFRADARALAGGVP